MKNLSSGFIATLIIILFVFGYLQGVVVPQAAQKYSQQASVSTILKNIKLPPPGTSGDPCNPQLVKCGTLRIKKNTIPDSYQDFTFAHNIPGYSPTFILDDDTSLPNPSSTPNLISLLTPYSGVFTITELVSPGFDTSISCTNANTGVTQMVSGNSISIQQNNANTYSCVFTNKSNGQVASTEPCNPQLTKCGLIKIRKDTIPNSYQDFTFTHNVSGYNSQSFILDDDGSLSNPSTLSNTTALYTPENGFFTLSETPSPDYNTSITCTNSQTGITSTVSGNSINIPMTNSPNVSCVFTNEVIVSPVASCSTPNTWTQRADFGGGTRRVPAGFSIGTKGYVGTGLGGSSGLEVSDFWEYNPVTNVWTQKANFGGGNRGAAVGFSIGTKGYMGLGKSGYQNYYSDFWEYNPVTNVWTQKANFGGEPRELATGFSIGSKGYVGVGTSYYASVGYTSYQDFWEYNPVTNAWTEKANFGGGNRYGSVGFSIGNNGYLGMGKNVDNLGNGPLYQDFWEYNPVTNAWTEKANFGGGHRMFATGFSIGGKGYAGTGRGALPGNSVTYRNDLWEYNPVTNAWTEKANLGIFGRSDAVGFSIGTKGYIGTGLISIPVGNNWNLQSSQDFWCYMP